MSYPFPTQRKNKTKKNTYLTLRDFPNNIIQVNQLMVDNPVVTHVKPSSSPQQVCPHPNKPRAPVSSIIPLTGPSLHSLAFIHGNSWEALPKLPQSWPLQTWDMLFSMQYPLIANEKCLGMGKGEVQLEYYTLIQSTCVHRWNIGPKDCRVIGKYEIYFVSIIISQYTGYLIVPIMPIHCMNVITFSLILII